MARTFSMSSSVSFAPRLGISASTCAKMATVAVTHGAQYQTRKRSRPANHVSLSVVREDKKPPHLRGYQVEVKLEVDRRNLPCRGSGHGTECLLSMKFTSFGLPAERTKQMGCVPATGQPSCGCNLLRSAVQQIQLKHISTMRQIG